MTLTGRVRHRLESPYGTYLYSVMAVGCGAAAGVLSAAGHPEPSVWFSMVASLALVALAVRWGSGVNTFLVVFAAFHALYGLSGPLAAVYGGKLPPIFTEPYEVSPYLLNYSLATVGLTLGVLVTRPSHIVESTFAGSRIPSRLLAQYAILLAAVASFMEMVNFVRVGGVAVALEGKALYQSLTTELTLDLPSNQVAMLATAVMALAVGVSRRSGKPRSAGISPFHVAAFVVALLPLLTTVVLLGQRGLLLGWVLVTLIGVTYGTSIRRISSRVVSLIVVVYLVMGVIYASRGSRGAALSLGDWSAVVKSSLAREALLRALNPAGNEFGSTFGNFSEYVKTGDRQLGLGRSYLVGFLLPMPSSLYPGKKPQQISYEFRDQVFPAEAERGSIAGTGYSPILEAYYDFREVGVFAVYVLIGMALVACERQRARSGSLWFALMYLMLVPSAVWFHRMSFGESIITPVVLNAAMVVAFWMTCSVVEVALNRPPKAV